MTPVLVLHHGDAQASYEDHPMEVARPALMAAARLERPRLAGQLRRIAQALPDRAPMTTPGAGER